LIGECILDPLLACGEKLRRLAHVGEQLVAQRPQVRVAPLSDGESLRVFDALAGHCLYPIRSRMP
jgi:hypothetical protein